MPASSYNGLGAGAAAGSRSKMYVFMGVGAVFVLGLLITVIALLAAPPGGSSSSGGSSPAVSRPCANSQYQVIRNVKHLTTEEKKKIVAGLLKMKTVPSAYNPDYTAYDYLVWVHRAATVPATQVHSNWYFFPWHREFMLRHNRELQRVTGDPDIVFPYWDWADQESTDALYDMEYLGPNTGLQQQGYVVKEGNFREGIWKLDPRLTTQLIEKQTLSMMRANGNGLQMCVEVDDESRSWVLDTPFNHRDVDQQGVAGIFTFLPDDGPPATSRESNVFLKPRASNLRCDWEDLNCTRYYVPLTGDDRAESGTLAGGNGLRCKHFAAQHPTQADYDKCNPLLQYSTNQASQLGLIDPNNPFATTKGYSMSPMKYFRACFEGVDASVEIAKGLERLGASLHPPHGATHTWGGGSLATPTSPNDPIFAHLHWNVDRQWAHFQGRTNNQWFYNGPESAKMELDMPLFDGVKLKTMMDHKALGYTFDDIC